MRVILKDTWFGPSDTHPRLDGTVITGTRYRKGEQELPDWLFSKLPKGTIVLEYPDDGSPVEAQEVKNYESLRDYDMERASLEAEAKIRNKVKADQDRIAAMNAARARNQAAKKAAAAEAAASLIKE